MSVRTSASTAWIRPRGIPTLALTSSNPARWAFHTCGITSLLFNLIYGGYINSHTVCWLKTVCLLQMRHLCDTGESREMRIEIENVINSSTPKLARNGLYLSPVIPRALRWSKKTRVVWSVWYVCCDHRCWNVITTCFRPRLLSAWQAVAR